MLNLEVIYRKKACELLFLRFLKSPEIHDYTDYEAITQITNALRNKEKSLPTGRQASRQDGTGTPGPFDKALGPEHVEGLPGKEISF